MRNAYTLLRQLHQWSALVLASYVAMYTLTGVVLIYPAVVPDRWSVREATSREVDVNGLFSADDATNVADAQIVDVADRLARSLGLRGRLDDTAEADGTWTFTFARPGTVERIRWTPGNSAVEVEVSRGGLRNMLNRLHHLDGYRGGLRFWIWAALLDIVNLSMIVFAGSGVYMWYVRKQKDRRLGWWILAGSTSFVVFSVVFLMLRK